MSKMLSTWYGKPIADLSREELLEVINHLSERLAMFTEFPGIYQAMAKHQVDQWRQSK